MLEDRLKRVPRHFCYLGIFVTVVRMRKCLWEERGRGKDANDWRIDITQYFVQKLLLTAIMNRLSLHPPPEIRMNHWKGRPRKHHRKKQP